MDNFDNECQVFKRSGRHVVKNPVMISTKFLMN